MTPASKQLEAIADRISPIQDRLHSRLPHQHQIVAAAITGAKWLCAALPEKDHAMIYKKTMLQLQAYRFRVLEQGELLTRLLCDLDLVLSDGDQAIRLQRKQTVLRIQDLLRDADALKAKFDRLSVFASRLLAPFAPETPPSSPSKVANDNLDNQCEDDDDQVDEPMDNEADDEGNDDNEEDDQNGAEEEEEEEEEEDEEMANEPLSPADVAKLPIWRPAYEIRRHSDGLALVANLSGVDPANLSVSITPDGVLQVTGYKLPSMTSPAYGRFLLREQFPLQLIDVRNLSYQLHPNGTLVVVLPRRPVHRPRSVHPSLRSPFLQAPFVW
ncbi:hypothetical protein SPRG_01138 [Saprolegnia parasitica CBS 223.65]|uniref:Uncharacterized protein n=1 Tax=Saprolegnia parasitica (strain CBS 223.65) TaxID=695850 RepID=A0A067CWJ4_SAPPC|nr:hypothetical protein SPRG_01138 [Saprolegnia parasitica CBS 223.65]KDO35074.1 hypothetical protein SPRG_01138 [Saprolegnia parasitica CBS 223.65]|eukprot:XP_012194727.1 hypothetical protein SPRG_01138 [Saprolegnia parasitica CBS 223.65]